ncbi:MAG: hypothetical protein KA004_02165 [Verrucomicrobiales bacterium]|nr:hypothetical protein [Verrucomicrobiales bacterium]
MPLALASTALAAPTEPPAAGFVIHSQDRLDVLAGYHRFYLASEGASAVMGWTGNYDTCTPGTTSSAFRTMIRRRVNFFRAMAGMPATISFDAFSAGNERGDSIMVPANTSKSTCAQNAALLQAVANEGSPPNPDPILSHNPPQTWFCWTAEGWNGSRHGNLALTYSGPEAIDAYMEEADGTDVGLNADVGHRRLMLYSRAQDMASGDAPGDAFRYASNCLYVVGNEAATGPVQFTAWPPAGYCPHSLVYPRWSLSHPAANFSNATVAMTNSAGTNIPVTLWSRSRTDLGDNTISWDPAPGMIIPPTLTNPSDKLYNVTVSNIIIGTQPLSHSYQVRLMDPSNLGSTPVVTGMPDPPQNGAAYSVVPFPAADSNDVFMAARQNGTTFSNGAESAAAFSAPQTNTQTLGQVRSTVVFAPRTGASAYHLTLTSANYGPQNISLTSSFIPSPASILTFFIQSRFLSSGSKLAIQATTDDGSSWKEVWAQTAPVDVLSTASSGFNSAWQERSVALGGYAGKIIRLRISFARQNSYVDGITHNHGVFVDDLSVSNCQLMGAPVRTPVDPASGEFLLTSAMAPGGALQPGADYFLSYQTTIGVSHFDLAPPLTITPTSLSGYDGWVAAFYPALSNQPPGGDQDGDGMANLVEYAFNLDPTRPTPASALPQPVLAGSFLKLTVTIPPGKTDLAYGAQFSEKLTQWEDLPAIPNGPTLTLEKNIQGLPRGYLRLKVVRPN